MCLTLSFPEGVWIGTAFPECANNRVSGCGITIQVSFGVSTVQNADQQKGFLGLLKPALLQGKIPSQVLFVLNLVHVFMDVSSPRTSHEDNLLEMNFVVFIEISYSCKTMCSARQPHLLAQTRANQQKAWTT